MYFFQQQGSQTKWIQSILKIMFEFKLKKLLRPRGRLVKHLIPLQFWQLKTLFEDGLENSKKFFLKTIRIATLTRLGSSLFHSITVNEKKIEKAIFSMKQSNFICISGIIIPIFLLNTEVYILKQFPCNPLMQIYTRSTISRLQWKFFPRFNGNVLFSNCIQLKLVLISI